MSITPGENDCNEEFDIDEQEKDIADQILDNILKMSGIERSFQPKICSNLMERKLLYVFQRRALPSFTKEVYPAYTSRIGMNSS